MSRLFSAFAIVAVLILSQSANAAHYLRFTGVSVAQGRQLQAQYPFVFERQVTLAEVDNVIRYLMKTGAYSSIDVVSRSTDTGPELLLVATALRKIKSIRITGNRALSTREVRALLAVDEGKIFERKELIESIKTLQAEYRKLGYRAMNAEIEFETPSESEVDLKVAIDEGGPTIVDRLQIESANPEVVQRMEKIVKNMRGKALSEDDLQKALRDMAEDLRNGRYLTARVLDPQPVFDEKQEKVRLGITIENPWYYQFRFRGNSSYDDAALIQSMNLDQLVGTLSTPAPELAERLRRFYQSKGYAHVEVRVEEKNFDQKFVRELDFTVDEGPRVRIKRIDISGNISRPGEYYAKFIESSSSDLIGQGFYNRRDVEEGIKKLEAELQNQGYLRAKVKAWRAEFANPRETKAQSDAQTALQMQSRGSQSTLLLTIDEGPLTVVRQIRFEGVEAFSKIQLQNALPIRTSESLRIKELNDSIDALKNFYFSRGYVEMKILNEQEGIVSYNDNSTQATVEFQISEGPKVTISSIVLEGNEFTKDYVILRELGMKPGDVYTPELRDDSIFHLQRLELFSRVNIRTLEEGTSIAERTVIVEVEESVPGAVETGVGVAYDLNLLYRGFVGTVYRNLWGTGRAISARIDPSYNTNEKVSYLEHKITVSYLEPYILRDRNKGRVNLTREIKWAEGYDNTGRTIMSETNALGLLVERDFTRNAKITYTAYSLSTQILFDRKDYQEIRTQNIAKTGPLFEFDYRDNVFYPTQGAYSTIGLEYSDPYLGSSQDQTQSIRFMKMTASTSYPQRLFNSPYWIFANALRVGYLVNLSNEMRGGVPAEEAFFLGGRSTIRGYQPTGSTVDVEKIPNLTQLGKSNLREFYVTTDSYYYLIKSEVRFPLWRNSPIGEMYGALFYDGGAVLLSQVALEHAYRHSVGPAIRVIFPGGIALSLEYGFKLNRLSWGERQEAPGAFHLSIGTF